MVKTGNETRRSFVIVPKEFQAGSTLHFLCLGICALGVVLLILAVRRARGTETTGRIRRFVGLGCLAAWCLNTHYWLMPDRIGWHQSLPIHFCYMANLIGAAAVLGGARLWKSVLYFWATTLCIWAFLTPVVGGGPRDYGFWLFWFYHLFIVLSVTEILFAQRFRPRLGDLRAAVWFTAAYTGVLALLDFLFGWNYGFVGPATPDAPTLLDVLGRYPFRLIWLGILGVLAFFLAWLPWAMAGERRSVIRKQKAEAGWRE